MLLLGHILLMLHLAPQAYAAMDAPCLKVGLFQKLAINPAHHDKLTLIFENAGLCATVIISPIRRSELLLLSGQLDGEYIRSGAWARQHEGRVVTVPTPVFVDKIMAVSLERKAFQFKSLADLKGYRVLIPGGHRWAEAKMVQLGVVPLQVEAINRFFELINIERVDAGLIEKVALSLIPVKPAGLRADPVAEISYYLVLHKKHRALLPTLDASVQMFLHVDSVF